MRIGFDGATDKCSRCWVRGTGAAPLYAVEYNPPRFLCGECTRTLAFRYRLTLQKIANRPCDCAADGCMHSMAKTALADR